MARYYIHVTTKKGSYNTGYFHSKVEAQKGIERARKSCKKGTHYRVVKG